MGDELQLVSLARHGETAWSLSGQHTGLTDLVLTEKGEAEAKKLGARLRGMTFAKVFTSPLKRAARTCEIAGFGGIAVVDSDLVEWDYGQFEGKKSAQIKSVKPDWELFRDGCPGGESPEQISARADRVVARVREVEGGAGDVLLFAHGHILRVIAARWLGVQISGMSKYLSLSTASLSAVGYDHERSRPVVRLWNETGYLGI